MIFISKFILNHYVRFTLKTGLCHGFLGRSNDYGGGMTESCFIAFIYKILTGYFIHVEACIM